MAMEEEKKKEKKSLRWLRDCEMNGYLRSFPALLEHVWNSFDITSEPVYIFFADILNVAKHD